MRNYGYRLSVSPLTYPPHYISGSSNGRESVRPSTIILACVLAACNRNAPAPDPVPDPGDATIPVERRIEAISFLGDTLSEIPLDSATHAEREALFEEARQTWLADPNDVEAAIWVGRRAAYLGRYQEAIQLYTLGIEGHPDDARLYRHRGHRYITTRQLDLAITDLEHAAWLTDGMSDEVEPDGLPNPRGVPTSTLQSNIWYHLGLARYLDGDFTGALEAYERCLAVSKNRDMEVATRYWLYLTLERLGRADEAATVAGAVSPGWDIIENYSYHRLLLLYQGGDDLAEVLSDEAGSIENTTAAYGVARWYAAKGMEKDANATLEEILSSGQWPAFGYIAAEADLAAKR